MYEMGRERKASEKAVKEISEGLDENHERWFYGAGKRGILKTLSLMAQRDQPGEDRLPLICLSNQEIVGDLTYSPLGMSGSQVVVDRKVCGRLGHGFSNLF